MPLSLCVSWWHHAQLLFAYKERFVAIFQCSSRSRSRLLLALGTALGQHGSKLSGIQTYQLGNGQGQAMLLPTGTASCVAVSSTAVAE
jgi:hypothetical protein